MSADKFGHLKDKSPSLDAMERLDTDSISFEHLPKVVEHFEGIIEKFSYNNEIVTEAQKIIGDVEVILNLGKGRIRSEVLKSAASDEYYNKEIV